MNFKDCDEKYYLESLWSGLEYIHGQIGQLQQCQRRKLCRTPSGTVHALVFQELSGIPEHHMIMNYFVWYACSLIVFLKLFDRAYSPGQDWLKEFSSEKKWRDKVAAHTAYTDSRKDDNEYTKQISIFMTPGWKDDRFVVGCDIIGGPVVDGKFRTSPHDWSWSITQAHEKLKKHIASASPR